MKRKQSETFEKEVKKGKQNENLLQKYNYIFKDRAAVVKTQRKNKNTQGEKCLYCFLSDKLRIQLLSSIPIKAPVTKLVN